MLHGCRQPYNSHKSELVSKLKVVGKCTVPVKKIVCSNQNRIISYYRGKKFSNFKSNFFWKNFQ